MADRTVSVNLVARISGFVAPMATAAKATAQLGREMDKAAQKGKADELIQAATVIGGGLVAAFGAAVYAAANFDKAMSGVSAATNATAGDMDRLRTAAMNAGRDTAYSATQAAQAETELAKAGVSVKDILSGGLTGALNLAAAGQMDVAQAAQIAAIAMKQFGLEGNQVPHVADLLAAAAGKATGEVHDIGMALNQAGLVANQFGLSIEETTGTLAAFASAGMIGSDAGTSLKTMLLRLANPAKEAKEQMEALGISAYDSSGQFVGMSDLAGQLQSRLSGLTQEQRDAALATIFGADAIRAANVLYQQGAKGVTDWTNKVNDAGYAAEVARKKTDNLAGDLERLKGALETVAIQAGGGASEGIRVLTKVVTALVNAFGDLPAGTQTVLTVMAGLAGATMLAGAGFLRMRQNAAELRAELTAMGPAGAKAATALGAIGKFTGWVGIAAGVLIGFKALFDFIADRSKPTAEEIDGLTKSINEFGKSGKVTGELAKIVGKNLSEFSNKFDDTAKRLKKSTDLAIKYGRTMGVENQKSLRQAQQDMKALEQDFGSLDKSLAELTKAGGATQAKLFFEQLSAAWLASGRSLDELKKKFPEYAKAAGEAAGANDGLAKGFGDAEQNTRTMAQSLEAATAAGQSLIDVWNQLNGAATSYAEKTISAEQSIDDLTESFRENGRTLDLNTEQGRNNMSTILDAAKAAAEAAQAKYEETGSVTEASKVYQGYVTRLRQVLAAAGLTQAQIDALIASYFQMPGAVTTSVTAPGATSTEQEIFDVNTQIQALEDRIVDIQERGAPGAAGEIALLREEIERLRDKTVTIRHRTIYETYGRQYSKEPRGTIPEYRHGGIVKAARFGLMTPAHIAGNQMIKYAEPETGGEAFIPRRGNGPRSKRILETAAGWYGGRVSWGGTAMGGSGQADAKPTTINIYPQRADFGPHDLAAIQARQDALARVGRPR